MFLWVGSSALDQAQYHALLVDLYTLSSRLVLALRGTLLPTTWGTPSTPHTPTENLSTLLAADLDRFCSAAECLLRHPPDQRHPHVAVRDPGQMRDFSRLDRIPPDGLLEPHYRTSYDSLENRLLKQTLQRLERRLAHVLTLPDLPDPARILLTSTHSRIQHLHASPQLQTVGRFTPIAHPTWRMQRDPHLRRVWQMWRHLQHQPMLVLDADTMALPIQRLDLLYERWCTLQVLLTLLDLPNIQPLAQTILHPSEDDWALVLREGGSLLQVGYGTFHLNLRYQPRYPPGGHDLGSLDRHTRIPDIAIEITCPDTHPRVIILDAKYRHDNHRGLPEEALADAYRYQGSIGTPTGQRVVTHVALLYPGHGAAECYPNGIAVIPLRPGMTQDLSHWLAQIV